MLHFPDSLQHSCFRVTDQHDEGTHTVTQRRRDLDQCGQIEAQHAAGGCDPQLRVGAQDDIPRFMAFDGLQGVNEVRTLFAVRAITAGGAGQIV